MALQEAHDCRGRPSAAQQLPADREQASAAAYVKSTMAHDCTARAAASQTEAGCAQAPADTAMGPEHANEVAIVRLSYMV
jgi:hypothetical protein